MKINRLLVLLAAIPAIAWNPFGGSPKNDTNEQLGLLFGKNTAFTATATMAAKFRSGKETVAEMEYACLDGKLRTQIDIAKLGAGGGENEALAMMQGLGLNLMVTIVRPDKKTTYVVYPGMNAYCEFPQTIASGSETNQPPKIAKTELGKETIDGHPCVKYKVVITAGDEEKFESTVWQATDLNDFPVKSAMTSGSDTVTTTFKNIKLVKPPAGIFEVPPGAKKYGSVQEMMMGGMADLLKTLRQ